MIDGGYAYGYLFMSQNKNAQTFFKELLAEVRPDRILEIGTFHGGLTLMLRDILDLLGLHKNVIRTYDINNQEFLKPLIKNRSIEILTINLFNESYSDFKDSDSRNCIKNFIQQKGSTVVLCDGGCKKCEFNIIAPLLKNNDIIMAHDYAPNIQYFKEHIENKIWNWMEIEDQDIKETIDKYSLQPFFQSSAQKAAWCCKIKH